MQRRNGASWSLGAGTEQAIAVFATRWGKVVNAASLIARVDMFKGCRRTGEGDLPRAYLGAYLGAYL